MSSSDFTFISLRNITAYQPTGSWVPQNYVLNMSTNGAATWTNSITLETLRASSIIGTAVVAPNIVGNTILSDAIIGSTIAVLSTFVVASSFFTTTTNYTYTGTSAPSSMLIVIGDNLWKIPVEFVSALD